MPRPTKSPKASRPDIPDYGISKSKKGMLPWKWAADRLTKSRQYWVVTVRSDGRPHVMPVWGVWLGNDFYFSTGRQTRKAKNLSKNPNCVICSEDAAQAAIVEGIAKELKDAKKFAEIVKVYKEKYRVNIAEMDSPVFQIRPQTVFGLFEKKFPTTATRWKFNS